MKPFLQGHVWVVALPCADGDADMKLLMEAAVLCADSDDLTPSLCKSELLLVGGGAEWLGAPLGLYCGCCRAQSTGSSSADTCSTAPPLSAHGAMGACRSPVLHYTLPSL